MSEHCAANEMSVSLTVAEYKELRSRNTIYTRITHADNCCGCINVTEGYNFDVIMTCNECGEIVGRADIPHN